MSLLDRLAGRLGYSRAAEAFIPPIEDEPPPSGLHSWGYRASAADARPFSSLSYHQMLDQAWKLYTTNPLANRIISIRTEFIVDSKSAPEAANRHVQQVLDDFWYDPVNDMPNFIIQATRQLLIFGLQVFPVFVNLSRHNSGQVGNGLARLGYVDPANIHDIHLDPGNPRLPLSVDISTSPTDKPKSLRVIHPDLSPTSPTKGLMIGTITHEDGIQRDELDTTYDGACFLFRINNLMNSKWGWSDLLPLPTWLEQANFFFTDIVQHIYWLTNFVWDLELTNASEPVMKARSSDIRANPPRRGSVLVHNDKEKWSAITPDLRQEDISAASRTLVWWIAGIGAGIPEHWLGWGRETTHATAKEMQSPTLHMLSTRQFYVHSMIRDLCRFQIDQAIRARILPPDVDKSFVIHLPDLLPPDLLTMTTAIRQFSIALSTPAAQSLIPPETARKLLALIAKDFSIDLEPPPTTPSEEPA